jgi:aminoglycoside-2''-adenylyltransferase
MPTDAMASSQLRTIGSLHSYFAKQSIDYWLFGGWAVDFHAGRVTRHHEDVDVAVWQSDLRRIRADLEANGWTPAPDCRLNA